jgi:hypothetical protein
MPIEAIADQLYPKIFRLPVDNRKHIPGFRELRQNKALRKEQLVVGIDDQRVVGVRAREFQRFGPIGCEVDPRSLDEPARTIGHRRPDDVLRPVGRSGIDDDPVIDQRPNRIETPSYDVRFVLDDHRQADGLTKSVHSNFIRD